MARRERDILEYAVHTAAEQAAKADDPSTRLSTSASTAPTRSPFLANCRSDALRQ